LRGTLVNGKATPATVETVRKLVEDIAGGVRAAR
jgi:hypothetical protein